MGFWPFSSRMRAKQPDPKRIRREMDEYDKKYGSATTPAGQDLPVPPVGYDPNRNRSTPNSRDTLLTRDSRGKARRKKTSGVKSPDFAQTAGMRKNKLGT